MVNIWVGWDLSPLFVPWLFLKINSICFYSWQSLCGYIVWAFDMPDIQGELVNEVVMTCLLWWVPVRVCPESKSQGFVSVRIYKNQLSFHNFRSSWQRGIYQDLSVNCAVSNFDGLSFLEKYAMDANHHWYVAREPLPPLHAASAAMESGGLKAEIAMKRLLMSRWW